MSINKLADNVWSIGVQDPNLTVFDIVMETKHGTSYNAFLIKGEKIALIDTVKEEFQDEYFANIESICSINEIDYLIVNHTEPDHSGAMPELLNRNPNIKIICSAPAMPFVKNILNKEADITGIKDNHELDLGEKRLQFKLMPYMHWPDTMMEFLHEDNILFSNDGFAAHVSSDSIWAEDATVDLDYEVYYYWDAIMRPFSGYIRRNLPKLDEFEIKQLAPSHGPIFRTEPRKYINKYSEWTIDKSESENLITVFYASNYGNTASMANVVAEELAKEGFTTDTVDVSVTEVDDLKEQIERSKAIVIGTPTFNGDAVSPVWDFVNLFSTVYSIGKKAAVFGSYAWGGEGAKMVADRLVRLKLKLFEEEYRARLIPSDDEISSLKEFSSQLAEFFNKGK